MLVPTSSPHRVPESTARVVRQKSACRPEEPADHVALRAEKAVKVINAAARASARCRRAVHEQHADQGSWLTKIAKGTDYRPYWAQKIGSGQSR